MNTKLVQQEVSEYLISMGMSEQQASSVIEKAKVETETPIPWNQDVSGYPPMLIHTINLSINPIALEWIEKNKPHAWFKDMFK